MVQAGAMSGHIKRTLSLKPNVGFESYTRRHRAFVLTLTLCLCAGALQGQEVSPRKIDRGPGKISCQVSHALPLQTILEVLNTAKLSGSLVVSGSCKDLNYPEYPEIPALCVAPRNAGSPLQTVRTMFGDAPSIHVSQDANGIIRMVGKGTPTDILKVKITHLSFDQGQGGIGSANAGLGIIKASPEFQLFLKSRNSKWPFEGGPISILADKNGSVTPTPSYVPHISGSIDDISIEAAMDRILKTFPGLWVYENCPGSGTRKRIVYFRFYSLQKSVNGTFVE